MQTLDPQSTSFQHQIQQQVAQALAEDIGVADFTAELSNPQTMGQATIVARESAVICGIPWVNQVFQQLSTDVVLDWQCQEGDQVNAGQVILKLHGPARAMLTGERTALNFLQTLSAVATLTKRYVELLHGTNACIMDTRKTIPGMRLAQKYAVRVGGGTNQRLGLYDGILIKENHILAAGSISAALQQAEKIAVKHGLEIQIEVENLDELQQALDAGAKLILLDNFSLEMLQQAVKINHHRAQLEASGGVNLTTVREIALTGVDRISTGDLTKNIQAIDLSMRFDSL
jgi:nicotinate-nucleotide pyrophosphorylase (carboxylating)